jgi:hypothetical protein
LQSAPDARDPDLIDDSLVVNELSIVRCVIAGGDPESSRAGKEFGGAASAGISVGECIKFCGRGKFFDGGNFFGVGQWRGMVL